nr:glycosyltransferase family 2 protein [uncultured Bacteroides sp.]
MGVKISIVTVTFNRAHVIKDAIEGVLKQNYKNYEYIIVDGKSKDNTVELLKEYETRFDGRMRWISEPDKGLYDAINKGIKMATGDVVGIINSDDYFHRTDTFDVIAKAFENGQTEAIYADEEDVNEENGKRFRYSGSFFSTWMYRIGMMPSHPTFYAKKDLFEKYGYYKLGYKIAADFELIMRFAYVNKVKMKYVPEAILTFRLGGVSTNLKNKMLLNKETVRALKENGLFACEPMIWLKYFFKIKQIVNSL